MSFDWNLFWQQAQNEIIAAVVVLPFVVVCFGMAFWWRRK